MPDDKPTEKIKRVMGFDFGTKRMGVAMGQRLTQQAQGISCINAKDGKPNWEQLDALVEEWQPDGFVVGLPFNMDGSESDMSRRANKFSKRLHGRYGLPSYTIDERLTTFEAKHIARQQGHKGHYKSDPVDELAAQFILETWLSEFPLSEQSQNQ
ncbi:Holliday junction resolvase RuvX [Bermanella marisrubri]|uniref:Putative pre-16S rRNA nuclease n=1 Tax=Bermanella marisrubri TaxID=207949 RepID=Q1MZ14_9GAMM|nr:Holliday junction resolvase RuvX [Bermanella marisrubri]EAT11214.1 Holliday junction resolvase-like protein [Oceanobacter sp. RED65] [Bermanella marisrubri]QIZ85651.1 Holliday junction resolvase RuvX [Bermanella marisrubri]